jgi:hypothetical protein
VVVSSALSDRLQASASDTHEVAAVARTRVCGEGVFDEPPGYPGQAQAARCQASKRYWTDSGYWMRNWTVVIGFGHRFTLVAHGSSGRVHRFLVHNVLARTGFSPPGVIFPVSVSIVRDMPAYDAALESFSKPLLSLLEWDFLEDEQRVVVTGETADHYRYFDATRLAEYLYDRVAETIRKDLAEELEFLGCFDRAYRGVRAVVDMPNKKVSLFVRLALQNGGRLPKSRRKMFAEITDVELAAMEAAVVRAQTPEEADDDSNRSRHEK